MNRSDTSHRLIWRAAAFAVAALVLTTVHHAYGAYVYDTPWRLHVAYVSGLTGALIAGTLIVMSRRGTHNTLGRTALWIFIAATVVVPVAGVGLFEGAYNHVLKNAMCFGGAPAPLLDRLFPPPMYEIPNNLFFEMTGVMQVVPGGLAGWSLYRLLRARWHESSSTRVGSHANVVNA